MMGWNGDGIMVGMGIECVKDEGMVVMGMMKDMFEEERDVRLVVDGRVIEMRVKDVWEIEMMIG